MTFKIKVKCIVCGNIKILQGEDTRNQPLCPNDGMPMYAEKASV